jgi:hypothetical protein
MGMKRKGHDDSYSMIKDTLYTHSLNKGTFRLAWFDLTNIINTQINIHMDMTPNIPLGRLVFFSFFFQSATALDTGRIKHDSNLSTNGLRRKISGESASDNSITSVRTGNLSPVDAVLGSTLSSVYGRFGDECNLLSEVEFGFFLAVYTLDFDQ